MAEQPLQDRTEQATPRRREEALERGNVARSTELNSVAVLLAAMAILKFSGEFFAATLNEFLIYTYHESSFISITRESFMSQTAFVLKVVGVILGPVLLIVLIAGMISNYAQIGFIFASKALIPDFKKISPLNGIKRMFSLRSLVELLKGILKITIVSVIAYLVLARHLSEYEVLAHKSVPEIAAFLADVMFEMGLKIGIALLVIAAADYAYQKWDYEKGLRMTKQEVREEIKQQEGSQQVKSKIRSLQLQAGRQRMLKAVPEATVVVTNPVFIAIALKYEPQTSSDAPKVVAKGKRKIAEKIREIARENDIPIVENVALARSMYDACEVGMEIPSVYYQAVAEIIAELFRAKRIKSILPGNN